MLDITTATRIVETVFTKGAVLEYQEGAIPRELLNLIEILQAGNIDLFDEQARFVARRFLDDGDILSLSVFSRVVVKALALKRLPFLDRLEADALIRRAYYVHASLCEIVNSKSPPDPIPQNVLTTISAQAAEMVCAGVETTVLLMVTRGYIENLSLWLRCFELTGQSSISILVVCLDDSVSEVMQAVSDSALNIDILNLGLEGCLKTGNGRSLSFIWYLKVLLVKILTDFKISVIYSDLDSFWIGDVEESIASIPDDVDVVFMEADDMPPISRMVIATTLGCGFFFVRATESAGQFFNHWLKATEKMLDDQIGLTELMLNLNASFESHDAEVLNTSVTVEVAQASFTLGIFSRLVAWRVGRVEQLASLGWKPAVIHPRWVVEKNKTSDEYLSKLLTGLKN